MNLQRVTIVRGLPGSGKSYFAKEIAKEHEATIVSADHFFETEDGEYNFDPSKLGQAHADCMARFVDAIRRGLDVVVDNTHSQLWEFENYVSIAQAINYRAEVEVFEVEAHTIDQVRVFIKRNSHGVPPATTLAMWLRWEDCTLPNIPVRTVSPTGPGFLYWEGKP